MSDKENKYTFWKRQTEGDVNQLVSKIRSNLTTILSNKYYNLWMDKFEWNGLDETQKEQQENYIMRKFWSDGTVAVRKTKYDDKVFMPYAVTKFNLYDFPAAVTLINKRGVSKVLIPDTEQTVNQDVCLLWCMPNHKSIQMFVDYYVDRMVQAEIVTNNNLMIQSMPFVIGATEEDKEQMVDIVDRILNGELVIYTGTNDIQKLQALITSAPYIVDKIKAYQVGLENELMTILGVNNSGVAQKKAQMLVDEVNANNDSITDYGNAIKNEITRGLERANSVLGTNITIKERQEVKDVDTDYENLKTDTFDKEIDE